MKKRILALLLVLCLALTPLSAAADSDSVKYAVIGGYLIFNKSTGKITGYSGYITQLFIPSEIDGVSVTGIEDGTFQECYSLTSVTISTGVTSIGSSAFRGCSNLTSVTIPDSVTQIGGSTFWGCNRLTSVTIPEGVTSIGYYTFRNCSSLTSVTIPSSVTQIADYAFCDCSSLTSVTIPEGVTRIGDRTFSGCSSLMSVTLPDGVTSIGNQAFGDCSSLTDVTLPDSVEDIGDLAFAFCESLTSVTIPNGVTWVGDNTFQSCYSLTSVTIPDSVTYLGSRAFGDCSSLTSVTIPDSVTGIGNQAFAGCSSLTSVTIPDSVTSIGESAFGNCSGLTRIEVSDENRNYCSINGVLFSKDKTELHSVPNGKHGVYQIPEGVTHIDESAFSCCSSLTSVIIPDGVTSIRSYAFRACSSLTSIIIPDSVTSIGTQVFSDCSSLTDIYYTGSESALINSLHDDLPNATIHYNSSYPVYGFFDMPAKSNWAFDGIKYCVENNLMAGMTDTTFEPNGTLTRGQLVAILWRQAGEPVPTQASPFTDLTMNYYRDAIAWAAEHSIVAGRDATHFDPNSPITRQELTAIFHRYVGEYLERDVSDVADITGFPDYGQVSNFANDAMAWAKGVGLISGDKRDGVVYLDPRGNATRAQAATMFMNLCETVLQ